MIYTIQINEEEKQLIISGLTDHLGYLKNYDCPEFVKQSSTATIASIRDSIKQVEKMLKQFEEAK